MGVVGRTGSGKSTLLLALTRILEPDKSDQNSKIFIDGNNVLKIPLNKLRRSFGVIPQDSYIIEGTLKENLDPLELFTDEEIKNAL